MFSVHKVCLLRIKQLNDTFRVFDEINKVNLLLKKKSSNTKQVDKFLILLQLNFIS